MTARFSTATSFAYRATFVQRFSARGYTYMDLTLHLDESAIILLLMGNSLYQRRSHLSEKWFKTLLIVV